jgi:hypothetical protein
LTLARRRAASRSRVRREPPLSPSPSMMQLNAVQRRNRSADDPRVTAHARTSST